LSGPVGLPVGTPLVWNDGCSIAKEVATSAAKMAMTDWNFIGCWRESTYGSDGVVGENNVSAFQRLAVRLVVRSRPWPHRRPMRRRIRLPLRRRPAELGMIARECVELARASHDETTLKLALMLAAKVRVEYPAQAKAAGL
jgi:hypothetical protein